MLSEYTKVKIKKTGIIGTIVDISTTQSGVVLYIVESDEKGVPGGYGEKDSWKLFDCEENEIEVIT